MMWMMWMMSARACAYCCRCCCCGGVCAYASAYLQWVASWQNNALDSSWINEGLTQGVARQCQLTGPGQKNRGQDKQWK